MNMELFGYLKVAQLEQNAITQGAKIQRKLMVQGKYRVF
jgi:hypothetical protein